MSDSTCGDKTSDSVSSILAVNFNKITEETNTQKYDIIIKYE